MEHMKLTEAAQTSSGPRWYVANVRPNSERMAAANLARQEFRCFLPSRLKTTRHARQFRTVMSPLFPGYVFVSLDLARQRWRSVNGTMGVVSLVMAGGWPVAVPEGIVESLVELTGAGGAVRFGGDLAAGQRVRLLAGPFAECIGTLDSLDDRGRVRVLLEMMGSHVPVSSRVDELTPA